LSANKKKLNIMEKGVLTLEQEKKLAELLDNAIKLNGILELIDGYVFKAVITFIDDTYIDKLSVDIKTQLAAIVTAVLANDVELAETLSGELISTLVKIPGLDEQSEGLLFKGLIEILVGSVIAWINKEKGTKVTLKINR
jgi:hypothetical protein